MAGAKKGAAVAGKKAGPAGITMPDAGLHVAVLGALLDAELISESAIEKHLASVTGEVEALDEDDMEGRLGVVLRRLHALPLPAAKVAKIEALDFDGGNVIYMSLEEAAGTYSGGETDVYSLGSLEGIGALSRLTRLDLDSHGSPPDGEASDLSPLDGHPALEELWVGDCKNADVLLRLPKLRLVKVLGSQAVITPASVLEGLEARGVRVERL